MDVVGCEKISTSVLMRSPGVFVLRFEEARREERYSQREIISPRYDLVFRSREEVVAEVVGTKWISFKGKVGGNLVDGAWQVEAQEVELSDSPPHGFSFPSIHGPILSGYGSVVTKEPLVVKWRMGQGQLLENAEYVKIEGHRVNRYMVLDYVSEGDQVYFNGRWTVGTVNEDWIHIDQR
ncbi:uncharacterized protein PGTG_13196 [Puccinia graminis f. sp. tritici CRL 75-36-700-3]|uniref:Uncharacterized protein n=1 Tax=Puccinia graminis f. sp. tritici (strain CRL 75-36-700-3 / race SCCL) TaxID=418459 RepID=E3KR89_PUCGT|nr:uncharacterized protein PGTG_13196 [Puccinia graminis f. sp. tritici CRL 75-36-700-3]EFP86814.1 hypothetical protein PGTG_13196 [Puccinia graminis f. sp. tritici CRL 75-36-700-3]